MEKGDSNRPQTIPKCSKRDFMYPKNEFMGVKEREREDRLDSQ